MKKIKSLSNFETLSTYNFVENKNKHDKEKDLNKKDVVFSAQTISAISIKSPTTIEEINSIFKNVQDGEPVIIDLTYKKSTLTQKVLNYLNGGVFALNGNIYKLVENVYIILPQGININLNN